MVNSFPTTTPSRSSSSSSSSSESGRSRCGTPNLQRKRDWCERARSGSHHGRDTSSERSRYGSSQENRGRSRSRSHIERRKSGKISKKIFNIQSLTSYFFNKISFSASKKNSHHKRRSPQSPRTSSPNKKSASQQSGLFLEPNLSESESSDEDSSQEKKGIFLLFFYFNIVIRLFSFSNRKKQNKFQRRSGFSKKSSVTHRSPSKWKIS